ncbi:MAG: hypothetical protein MZV63_26615 [Marinilabiliales bacterium]|nr:hypothetical protein [Marinilabiliales bacterium]
MKTKELLMFLPCPSLTYPELACQVFSLDRSGNDIYFSTYDNKLFTCTISGEKIINIGSITPPYRYGNIEDIYFARDGSFWVLWSARNLKKYHLFVPLDLIAIQYKLVNNGGIDAVKLVKTDSLIFHETQDLLFSNYETYREKYFTLSPDPSGKVFLGRYEGLLETENGIIKFKNQKGKLILDRIADIKTSEKLLFAGTRNNGLQVIDISGNAFSITDEHGLNSNLVKCILIDQNSSIWVGTDKGLNHIYYSGLKGTLSHIATFNIRDGLLSNQINDLVGWNNSILAATKNGIMIFDPVTASKSTVLPVIALKSILINDKIVFRKIPRKLRHNENTIVFNFDGTSIRNPERLYYEYMLEGVDKDWMKTGEAMVRYPKLGAGRYTFLLNSGFQ